MTGSSEDYKTSQPPSLWKFSTWHVITSKLCIRELVQISKILKMQIR